VKWKQSQESVNGAAESQVSPHEECGEKKRPRAADFCMCSTSVDMKREAPQVDPQR
ncbi:hypothetical protein BgiBS90_024068, partial [Biomphalaria glabrata]